MTFNKNHMLLIFIENVYFCFDLDRSQTDLIRQFFNRWTFSHDEYLSNPKMTFFATFKSSKCENYDPSDLENKIKVKLMVYIVTILGKLDGQKCPI